MHEWHEAKVLSLAPTATGLDHLVVSVPDALAAAYTTAGQYTRLMVQGHSAGIYALASAPAKASTFEYLVKNGGSVVNAIASLTTDTALKISEPMGHGFPLERVGARPLWLLGTGSGLAPLRAVVKALLNQPQRPPQVTLLYGARNEMHVPFVQEFSEWQKQGIEVRLTLSQPPSGWKGLRGYVQAHVSDIGRGDGVVFLCGQKHMMEEAGRMLDLVGVGKERIFLNV